MPDMRGELKKMSAIANKRIERLKANGLDTSPAYRAWADNGAKKFGLKNATNKYTLQSEYWRVKNFLNAKTSTVRGCNEYLKKLAKATKLKYKNLGELKKTSKEFFELADRIEEYFDSIGKQYEAANYNRIFERINIAIKTKKIDLNDNQSIEDRLKAFLEVVNELVDKNKKIKPKKYYENKGFIEL